MKRIFFILCLLLGGTAVAAPGYIVLDERDFADGTSVLDVLVMDGGKRLFDTNVIMKTKDTQDTKKIVSATNMLWELQKKEVKKKFVQKKINGGNR